MKQQTAKALPVAVRRFKSEGWGFESRNHAVALGLLGWYLMVPPTHMNVDVQPPSRFVDGGAPIGQWTVERAFDASEPCNRLRDEWMERALKALKKSPDGKQPSVKESNEKMLGSQCIASDDPRLAK